MRAAARRGRRVPSAAILAALLMAGCQAGVPASSSTASAAPSGAATSSPRPLVEPTPTGAVATQCRTVMAALPQRVDGLTISSTTRNTAQWGGDIVSLRCGVPKPAALQPTSSCNVVDNIGWLAVQTTDRWVFTTIGRSGYIEVTVASSHQPAANALVDLSRAVTQMREVKPCV